MHLSWAREQRDQDRKDNIPLFMRQWERRVPELEKELAALPPDGREARAVLYFTGAPVHGTIGIDAGFAGNALVPFQEMVATDYAARERDDEAEQGSRAAEPQGRLLLTGLPRGSFGLELSCSDDAVARQREQIAESLDSVVRLVEASARGEEEFAAAMEKTSAKVIPKLKEFLAVVSKGNAGVKIENGDFSCEITSKQASDALERVDGADTKEESLFLKGTLNGAFLHSRRFEFVSDDSQQFSGKIDSDLSAEAISSVFNKRCEVTVMKITVRFKNGRSRVSYVLKDVKTGK
jgi:hypothetical protein